MRTFALLSTLVLLAGGCSPRDVQIHGTFADGWTDPPRFVAVEGGDERVEVENGSFALSAAPARPVVLRIEARGGRIARIRAGDLPRGSELRLDRIRHDGESELAFPSAVRLKGTGVVEINGIRMADSGVLPNRVAESGVVLATRSSADALILRPEREDLPDLPVVITSDTRVTDRSGTEARLSGVSSGDSMLVEGRTEAGYLLAERIRLAREPTPATPTPTRAPRPAATPTEPAPRAAPVRPAPRPTNARGGRAEREERGRGRERGRGNEGIPPGQRPPPGECRDWNPNLPPGQQPPPRRC